MTGCLLDVSGSYRDMHSQSDDTPALFWLICIRLAAVRGYNFPPPVHRLDQNMPKRGIKWLDVVVNIAFEGVFNNHTFGKYDSFHCRVICVQRPSLVTLCAFTKV